MNDQYFDRLVNRMLTGGCPQKYMQCFVAVRVPDLHSSFATAALPQPSRAQRWVSRYLTALPRVENVGSFIIRLGCPFHVLILVGFTESPMAWIRHGQGYSCVHAAIDICHWGPAALIKLAALIHAHSHVVRPRICTLRESCSSTLLDGDDIMRNAIPVCH